MAANSECARPRKRLGITRREFVRQIALWGVAAGATSSLAACTPQATATPVPGPTQAQGAAPAASPTAAPTKAPAATATPAGPKILRVRLASDIAGIDPAFMVGLTDSLISDCIFMGLVCQKPNSYEWMPDAAESVVQSPDGLTIDFKLKEGIKWQKGYGELTTEDVKYSFERIADKNTQSPYANDWLTLDHVEIIDKYRGKIILKEPFAPLFSSTLPVNSGRIVCKKYVEQVGKDKFTLNPEVGSGPYMFAQWTPKQKIVLKRNPDYSGPHQVYYDEIHVVVIPDSMAAEVALQAGDVDHSSISAQSFKRFAADAAFKSAKYPPTFYYWIGMNVTHPKLQDINVRQAVRYAVDVDQILAAVYYGEAERANSMLAEGLVGYWKDAPRYNRDVQKAKDYLAKAGVSGLTLKYNCSSEASSKTQAEIVQQNLAEVGIKVDINVLDGAAVYEQGMGDNGKQIELYSSGFSMYPDPAWATMWFTCDQVGVWNWMRWCSPEYDALNKKGITTLDPAERAKIYIRMQQLLDESCSMIWTTHGVNAFAWSPKVMPAMTPNGQQQLWNFRPA